MKAVRRFKRKVRLLVAQKRRLVRELRATHARARRPLPLPRPSHSKPVST